MSESQARTKRKTPRKTAAKRASPRPRARKKAPDLLEVALAALEDMKAVNVKVIDVRHLTDVTDTMVVATGTSDRHVRSIAGRVVEQCKAAGFQPMGVEGERDGEWVLVDLRDALIHVMLPRIRDFYGLEKLWDVRPSQREPALA
ncbi:MAG TPA: ribosome silencing factor [Steroidobacteraceae bacterium]|jgi:ribosome-associated protein|nr:ribosome silencing factor [Steroidobacteraceae bacterium]